MDTQAEKISPRFFFGMLLASVLVPALLAAAGAETVADAAHDEGVVRAVGLGWTGVWRGLDAPTGALLGALPIGTRAMRAALGCGLVGGAGGGLLFYLAHELCAKTASSPRLSAAAAAIGSLTATLSIPWQTESASAGGAVTGAALVLLPLVLLRRVQTTRIAVATFALGLALTYEPWVFAQAALASVCLLAMGGVSPERCRLHARRMALGFALGLLPLGLVLGRAYAAPELALAVGPFAGTLAERTEGVSSTALAFLRTELGWIVVGLSAVGAGIAVFVARARPLAVALVGVVTVAFVALSAGAPAGPTRYAAPVLAGLAAMMALAAVALQAIVRVVAAAKIPFATASAVMIVILELTLPVRSADDTLTRREGKARAASAAWDEVAWGPLPGGAVLLVSDRRLMSRVLASRAEGEMRPDLAIVPTFDLGGHLAARELAREPRLAPFYRDMSLGGAPEEFSLASLGAERPLLLTFDPRWERALSRHLVPVGLVTRFEPEPRGASERRRALDAFSPARDDLVRAILLPTRDLDLVAVTAKLLRARAIAMAASGERDLLSRALDDLRPFTTGDDPVAALLVRRIVTTKGPIDVKDLSP